MDSFLEILAAAMALLGAFAFLVTAIAMVRVRDALSRVNALGPATALGLPLILGAAFIHQGLTEGWEVIHAIEVGVAILAALVVSSLASNMLGRATYRSGATIDPTTEPNELAGR